MNPFTAAIWQTTSLPTTRRPTSPGPCGPWRPPMPGAPPLLVLPEMFLTGYLIRDRLEELAEPVPDGPSLLVLREKARALSLGLVVGLPVAHPGGKPYNALVMIDRDGSVAGVQGKTHFFGGGEKMFDPGPTLRAFDTSFGRMGLLVCYDGEFPETARSPGLGRGQTHLHGGGQHDPL